MSATWSVCPQRCKSLAQLAWSCAGTTAAWWAASTWSAALSTSPRALSPSATGAPPPVRVPVPCSPACSARSVQSAGAVSRLAPLWQCPRRCQALGQRRAVVSMLACGPLAAPSHAQMCMHTLQESRAGLQALTLQGLRIEAQGVASGHPRPYTPHFGDDAGYPRWCCRQLKLRRPVTHPRPPTLQGPARGCHAGHPQPRVRAGGGGRVHAAVHGGQPCSLPPGRLAGCAGHRARPHQRWAAPHAGRARPGSAQPVRVGPSCGTVAGSRAVSSCESRQSWAPPAPLAESCSEAREAAPLPGGTWWLCCVLQVASHAPAPVCLTSRRAADDGAGLRASLAEADAQGSGLVSVDALEQVGLPELGTTSLRCARGACLPTSASAAARTTHAARLPEAGHLGPEVVLTVTVCGGRRSPPSASPSSSTWSSPCSGTSGSPRQQAAQPRAPSCPSQTCCAAWALHDCSCGDIFVPQDTAPLVGDTLCVETCSTVYSGGAGVAHSTWVADVGCKDTAP